MKAYLHWEISRICLTDLSGEHHDVLQKAGEIDLTREEAHYLHVKLGRLLADWIHLDEGLDEINERQFPADTSWDDDPEEDLTRNAGWRQDETWKRGD